MKKNKFLILILGLFLIFMENVYADDLVDTTCNAVSFNELRTQAANVKISYVEAVEKQKVYAEMLEDTVEEEVPVLYIKIYNLTSKLYITYDAEGGLESNGTKKKALTLDDVYDGAITIKQPALPEMVTYTFTIASDSYGCGNRNLRTVKLTLPRFNYYSRLSVCQDIPDYYLCKTFVTFNSDNNADFYTKVNEYKAKLEEQKEKGDGDGNIISDTLSSVSKNKYIIVGVIVAVGVVVTVLILRRKRSDK